METVVVRRDPLAWRRQRWLALALLVLLPLAGFVLGHWQAGEDYRLAAAERGELERKWQGAMAELGSLEERLTTVELGSAIDLQALETLRGSLRQEQAESAALREELAFYRGLMAPEQLEEGLGIRTWEMDPLSLPRRYGYRLVVYQRARNHVRLEGHVEVDVVGLMAGEESTLPLHELSSDPRGRRLPLRFTYFQNLEGELELPEGFRPLRVEVTASVVRPREDRVQRQFGWVNREN